MYRRSTRELSFDALPGHLRDALSTYAQSQQLELGSGRCWLTHSENPPSQTFFGKMLGRRSNPVDPDAEHHTALLLHSTHLLVAVSGEKRGVSVLSVALSRASLQRGSPIAERMGISDPDTASGVTIEGFDGDAGRPGTYFVGLGPEPASAECSSAVEEAIRRRKNA